MAHVSAVGSRVLAEIEEAGLDEILADFREGFWASLAQDSEVLAQTANLKASRSTNAAKSTGLKHFPISGLNALVARHFRATQSAPLVVSGRNLPLTYLLIATLIASPHEKAVVVVDLERRFDVTRVFQCTPHTEQDPGAEVAAGATSGRGDVATARLHCTTTTDQPGTIPKVTASDLAHLHVYRPAHGSPEHLREVIASAEEFMLYGQHGSHGRAWWGTIVVGGSGASGDVAMTAAWKGWLRVDRQELAGHAIGLSAEEALLARDRRQQAFDNTPWVATSPWGDLRFTEG